MENGRDYLDDNIEVKKHKEKEKLVLIILHSDSLFFQDC